MPQKTHARSTENTGAREWAFALVKNGFSPFQAEPAQKVRTGNKTMTKTKAILIALVALAISVIACSDGENETVVVENGGGDDDSDDTDDEQTEEPTWTDPATGLMWQIPFSLSKQEWVGCPGGDWADEVECCEELQLEGFSDWRMPSISELRTLIRNCPGTETDGTCDVSDSCTTLECHGDPSCEGCKGNGADFYGEPKLIMLAGYVLSSTTIGDEPDLIWCVNYDTTGGEIDLCAKTDFDSTATSTVCVR